MLKNLKVFVPRCLVPVCKVENVQLHLFSDGSNISYGSVAYLRVKDSYNNLVSNLIMSMSRLVPRGKTSLNTTLE